MTWCIQDINKRIWEFERDYPSVNIWTHPAARMTLSCELWLLEPPEAMSGVEQQWPVNGCDHDELGRIVSECSIAQIAIEGSEVAIAMADLPIFKFKAGCWEVGDFDTKDQVRLRRVIPLGMLLLMREVVSQAAS